MWLVGRWGGVHCTAAWIWGLQAWCGCCWPWGLHRGVGHGGVEGLKGVWQGVDELSGLWLWQGWVLEPVGACAVAQWRVDEPCPSVAVNSLLRLGI
jgi:hypothetical protein